MRKRDQRCDALVMTVFLASSLSLSGSLYDFAWAGPGPVNTINENRIVRGGTYYNTPDNKTTFIDNRSNTGLWVQNGTVVRGLEVDNAGNPTNHGGTLHFYAPGGVVRLDGTLDVSALRNDGGTYLGNGGRVFIDSAYLFQNGNIFANGQNGGLVQMNVARMTLGPTGRIEARGFGGSGGIISVNSSGIVDLQNGSVLDSSGKVTWLLDTNVINIEGGLINAEGNIRADGIDSRGGTVRLVATGQTDPQEVNPAIEGATEDPLDQNTRVLEDDEASQLRARALQLSPVSRDGDVRLASSAIITANGSRGTDASGNDRYAGEYARAGDGGTVLASAAEDVVNFGSVHADGGIGTHASTPGAGGHGGTVVMAAQGQMTDPNGQGQVINTGLITANGGRGGANTGNAPGGQSGSGGLLAFNYHTSMINRGQIEANGARGGAGTPGGRGGNGGLAVFSGLNNPTGGGTILTNGGRGGSNAVAFSNGGLAGTIVTPNPASANADQRAVQRGYLNGQVIHRPLTEQTKTTEVLTRAENLILLSRNGGDGIASTGLFDRIPPRYLQGIYRSVQDPTGSLGLAANEIGDKGSPFPNSEILYRNLIVGSTRDNLALDMSPPTFARSFPQPSGFEGLNTLTVSNRGSVVTNAWERTSAADNAYYDFWAFRSRSFVPSGDNGRHISVLAKGDFTSMYLFDTRGEASGGSINIATSGDILNGGNNAQGRIVTVGQIHGGAITLKAGRDIVNSRPERYRLNSIIHSSFGLMGGVLRFQAGRDFYNLDTHNNSFGGGSISARGGLQAGIIRIDAQRNLLNSVLEPEPQSGPAGLGFPATISANGGRGGYIQLFADKFHENGGAFKNFGIIQANGPEGPDGFGTIKLNEF